MKPASILITDDESNIRVMLRTALESDGYNVREAASGREALESMASQVPDLMVLDLNMPAIDGMAVLEQMKALAKENRPRVIVLTAYGSIPAAVKACRLGAMDFLEKPITPTALREAVADVLDETPINDLPVLEQFERSYEGVLEKVRRALRMADYTNAESLLMRAADLACKDPAYYNLMGILYESRRQFRLAKKFFHKALSVHAGYEPALLNLTRLLELQSWRGTSIPIAFGTQVEDEMWVARLPHDPRSTELKHF